MKFRLSEYNVVPDPEKRDAVEIQLVDSKLLYNGQQIEDNDKIVAISNFLMNHKDDIVSLNQEKVDNYKGGRQRVLNVQFEDTDWLWVIGNTPSEAMANLYSELRSELINIIEQ